MSHSTYTGPEGTIRVMGDGVLVRMKEERRQTAGGLVIPDSAYGDQVATGVVLAYGTIRTKKGVTIPIPDINVGDGIAFVKAYKAVPHNKELRKDVGGEIVLIKARDVLAVWGADEEVEVR